MKPPVPVSRYNTNNNGNKKSPRRRNNENDDVENIDFQVKTQESIMSSNGSNMGMTFGDGGFNMKSQDLESSKKKFNQRYNNKLQNSPPVDLCKKGAALDIIYENEMPQAEPSQGREGTITTETDQRGDGTFKENMLLSFYNWPKVETSAVF